MFLRALNRLWWLLAVVWLASPSFAQTADDLFDPTVVNDLKIVMNPADWAHLKTYYLDNTYYPAVFNWKNLSAECGIRSRGSGSRSQVKPGIKVEFNRYDPSSSFLGLQAIDLRNNVQDPSQIHERIAMLFYPKMGLPSSREAHVRMFVNNEFIGLYTFVEVLDINFLSRWFKENTGYLYNYKHLLTYHWSILPDLNNYIMLFKAETNKDFPNWTALMDFVRTINQSSDSSFAGDTAKYIDLKLFLAHLAVENYLAENDGITGDYGTNNFYLYRFANKTLHQFLPWDRSNVFSSPTRSVFQNSDINVLTQRALAVPELKTAYMTALANMANLAGGAGGFLETEINYEYNQIRNIVYSDANKQCPDARGVAVNCTNDQFEAEIASMKTFARQRQAFVYKELAAAGLSLPSLSVSGASLNFQTTAGINPPTQTLTINAANTTAALNWTALVSSGATWLSLSPSSGATPTPITVTASSAGLAAGTYNANIAVTSGTATNSPVTVAVTLTITASGSKPPVLSDGGAVNAATSLGTTLAPGSLISLYGVGLAAGTGLADRVPLPTSISAASVLVNGTACPLVYVSPGQINFQLPWETTLGKASLSASLSGALSNAISINVGAYSPGVFVTVYPDGRPVDASKPAAAGDILVVYANGLGPVKPVVATGAAATTMVTTNMPAAVTIGGVSAEVQFSGLSGFVGLYQVNVKVPAGIAVGNSTPLVLSIGGQTAPPNPISTR